MFLIDLTFNQSMGMILAVIGIIPSFLLLRLYLRTKIPDYFLFGLFFIDGIIVLIMDPIAGLTNILIFYQIHHVSIDTAFFILFIHACRMIWREIPKKVLFIGIFYYLTLFLMTLMWHVFTQPAYAEVIFIYLPHSFSTYYPNGAGLTFNNTIIYSTSFRYIGEFFRLFSLIFLFYAYLFKTKKIFGADELKMQKARRIWLLVWIMFLLHTISLFPWFEIEILGIFLVFSGILIFYISFFLPEGLLLSSAQITRILPLYSSIKKQAENHSDPTVENISSYLDILAKEDFND